ncbi:MAG TPA: hypothetical protein VGW98_05930 [Solirubrobacteraceae bacterium]|jgi:hypothetical protein|nr:hypothetical protein [Solirubrobacteraceae bacterium]
MAEEPRTQDQDRRMRNVVATNLGTSWDPRAAARPFAEDWAQGKIVRITGYPDIEAARAAPEHLAEERG